MSIKAINFLNRYEAETTKITQAKVSSIKITQLYKSYIKIMKVLKDNDENNCEKDLKLLRNFIYRTILNVDSYKNIILAYNKFEFEFLKELLKELFLNFEELKEDIKIIIEILKEFKSSTIENPIEEKINEFINKIGKKESAIIITPFEVEKVMNDLDINFSKESDYLKSFKIYDYVFFIGSPHIYKKSQSIFMGKNIIYIYYDFFESYKFLYPLINNNYPSNVQLYKNTHVSHFIENQIIYSEEVGAEELEIENERVKIESILKKNNINDLNNSDSHEGSIITFFNDKYYILAKGSKFYKVKNNIVYGDSNKIITRTGLDKLTTDDWVIIKSNTESNFILEKSKDILGDSLHSRFWYLISLYKKALIENYHNYPSNSQFLKKLKENEIKINDINTFKYWVSDRCIKPKQLEKILIYLDFNKDKINEIIHAAKSINSSHIKAGRLLLENLNESFKNFNMNYLFERMNRENTFKFTIEGVGEFSIEKIKYISNDLNNFSFYDLNKLKYK